MDSVTEMLEITGLQLLRVQAEGDSWQLEAKPVLERPACPYCAAAAARQHRHGWRSRNIAHLPVGLKPCNLVVRFARLRCQACGRTHTPELPGIRRRARLSDSLRRFVSDLVARFQLGIQQLSRWLRLGWHTLWRCVRPAAVPGLADVEHLCVDEVFFREPRRYLTVLSAAGGWVLGLEPGRGAEPVRRLLSNLPEETRAGVRTLATDFSLGQRRAALECLPTAEIVADCFHLVRLARRCVRESQPGQQTAARQAVRELRCSLRRRDQAALSAWLNTWRGTGGPLGRLWKTVDQWELEIEGYLSTGRSTGPAEALNRKIALLRRQACGYTNLDNFSRRIFLLNCSLHPNR